MYITKGNVGHTVIYYCALYNTVYNRKHETVAPKEQLLFRRSGKNGHAKNENFRFLNDINSNHGSHQLEEKVTNRMILPPTS